MQPQPQRHALLRPPLPLIAIMLVATVLGGLLPRRAHAAGLLVADGGFGGVLEIREHSVDVTINNGVAVTIVDQTFVNTEQRTVEALYTFPVPNGASVADFSMWINGKEMTGEVLEKERAREIYETYKRQTRPRDPGLLEQVDYKTFEMRIFPILAGAEQRVRVTYYQELDTDHDWSTYVYPLATVTRPGVDSRTTGRFALRMRVKSEVPIVAMESPSHRDDFVIARHGDHAHEASLEATGGDLSRDVVLAFQTSRPRTGVDLITSTPKGEDGYFLLTLTAGEELAALDQAMDYVFVVDISGSMATDGKLRLSKEAVGAFVEALSPEDRFEVIAFNVQPAMLFNGLRPVDDANRSQAVEFLGSQQARGGTVLAPAIQTAYKFRDSDRPLVVVVLSDGMTEQTERRDLLQLISARPGNTRVFCIGIGNEVNRPLLDQLAQDAGGLAAFISHGDDFERQAQAFRRKLTRPVATDLRIALEGAEVYDVEPAVLPNLYHGTPVRMYGRYRGGSKPTAVISGDVLGKAITTRVDVELPAADGGNPEIERMWAWHRIDRLLKEADRNDARTSVLDEVVRLGEAYSIATEYTSFIVLENDSEYQRWNIDRRNALRIQRDRAAQERVHEELDQLRQKALANLGPAPDPAAGGAAGDPMPTVQDPAGPTADASSSPSRGWDIDLGGGNGGGGGSRGGGALDPLSACLLLTVAGGAVFHRRRAA